jgi:hypothetical protein
MTDISDTVLAKSDQLNADDLIGGPITVKITRVTKSKEPDQPISVNYEGDGGKPYKPGKSMRRVMIAMWGKDSDAYIGQSMTLYRDPKVRFGKLEVGGIRISHATGIDRDQAIVITVKQGQKGEFHVKRLQAQTQQRQTPAITQQQARADIAAAMTLDDLRAVHRAGSTADWWPDVKPDLDARRAEIDQPREQQTNERQSDQDARSDSYDGV